MQNEGVFEAIRRAKKAPVRTPAAPFVPKQAPVSTQVPGNAAANQQLPEIAKVLANAQKSLFSPLSVPSVPKQAPAPKQASAPAREPVRQSEEKFDLNGTCPALKQIPKPDLNGFSSALKKSVNASIVLPAFYNLKCRA